MDMLRQTRTRVRHPEAAAPTSAFMRVLTRYARPIASRLLPTCALLFRSRVNARSVDARPGAVAVRGSPHSAPDARKRAFPGLAPQGDGRKDGRASQIPHHWDMTSMGH